MVTALTGRRKHWARVDEMEAQRERTPKLETDLQKALRTEPFDWVCDWQTLPPEDPAGHRKAYRRIAQMHHSHTYPQSGSTRRPSGEESTSDSIDTIATRLSTSKAQQCHRNSTSVIGVTRRVRNRRKARSFWLFPGSEREMTRASVRRNRLIRCPARRWHDHRR